MNKLKSSVISCWLLVIIIIIAAFLRLYNLTEVPPGLYPDEAMNGNNALEALRTGHFKVFYPENNGREGLFINIQAIFLKFLMLISGENLEPWMLRLPSAIFGILTVLGTYFLTKQLFKFRLPVVRNVSERCRAWPEPSNNILSARSAARESRPPFAAGADGRPVPSDKQAEYIALLSAFFLATSFWHINFSRIGFRAIMAPFFLVWGIYLLIKSLNQTKNNFQFSIFNFQFLAIIGGIMYGLGFYSYIAYRATPILIFVILLIYWLKDKDIAIRKKFLLSTFYFLLSTIIIAAPLGLYFLKNPQDFFGRTSEISIFNSSTPLKDLGLNILKTAGMFNFVGDWNWRHNYAGRPELFWPVGILFAIGILIGLKQLVSMNINKYQKISDTDRYSLRDTYRYPFVILFSWLVIAALPVVVSNEGIPHALRSILLIPPVFILAGFGGIWLYEKIAEKLQKYTKIPKLLLFSIFYFLFSLFVFEAYYTYFIKWAKNHNTLDAFSNDYVCLSKKLKDLPKELPKYVVVEAKGVDVRGIPMPAQTVMFLTDTFSPEKQKEKNIYYVLPNQTDKIPQNSYVVYLK